MMLEDPMAEYDLPTRASLESDSDDDFEHPAAKIRREAGAQRASKSLDYSLSSSSDLKTLLKQGKISEQDYDQIKKSRKQANMQHLGYAFITFTHKDEAMYTCANVHNLSEYDDQEVAVMVKGDLDHKNFDPYFNV
jgi:hypothetical protein